MSTDLGKPIREHITQYGTILEFELPKKQLGFRQVYDFSESTIDKTPQGIFDKIPSYGIRSTISRLDSLVECRKISRNAAYSLSYLLDLRERTGQWIGICAQQHNELIPTFLKNYGLWDYCSSKNPTSEMFDFAIQEQERSGKQCLGQIQIGPRRVVFAKSYEILQF